MGIQRVLRIVIRTVLTSLLLMVSGASAGQQFSVFELPPGARPFGIALGSDGALWFPELGSNRIGRISISGELTEFSVLTPNSAPSTITRGPDGNMWFVETMGGGRVGRITPNGLITEFVMTAGRFFTGDIAAGPDGNVWATMADAMTGARIAKISPSGAITEYLLPRSYSLADGITAGPDGNIWFTRGNQTESSIGRMTVNGEVTGEWQLSPGRFPTRITAGADGNLWFTELEGNSIGRITPGGAVTEFPIPTLNSRPRDITLGDDGYLYFVESNASKIGRISAGGVILEFRVPFSGGELIGIAAGPSGTIWFTDSPGSRVGRFNTSLCALDPTTLCLSERFRVRLRWRQAGTFVDVDATAVPLTRDTGAFWFFSNQNLELMVKVVDGRGVNGHFWVFFGSLTNVEFTLDVLDTVTGTVRAYTNQQGELKSFADTSAF